MEKKFLEENVVEARLKKYFRYMESIYGEEIAIKTALSDRTLRSSIEFFSDDFENFQDYQIDVEFLKVALLTDRPEDIALKYANKLIAEGKIEQLLMDMDANPILKMALVENYINHMYTSTETLYNKAKENPKYRIIDRDLGKLKEYQEKHELPVRKKITKKEEKKLVKKYQPETVKETEKVERTKRRRKAVNS